MSREIRRVPANWEHPKNERGAYINLLELDSYKDYLSDWKESRADYDTKEEWMDAKPDKDDFMPSGEWYQLFQTVGEGTPLSPPFATKEELVTWLTENEDYWGNARSREAAEWIVEKEFALSGAIVGGKIYTPETMHKMPNK